MLTVSSMLRLHTVQCLHTIHSMHCLHTVLCMHTVYCMHCMHIVHRKHAVHCMHTVQNIWAPLRKLFAPPGVPGWLRACLTPTRASKINPCPPHAHSSAGSRNPRELISPAQNLLPEQRRTVLAHTRNEERAILLRKKSIRDTIH